MAEDIKELNMKKLYRSRDNRILFGVCGGMAKYLNIDATIIRILFILLIFAEGVGFVFYLILIALIPLEPGIDNKTGKEEVEDFVESIKLKKSSNKKVLFGIIFILIGLSFLINRYFPISFYLHWLNFINLWPYIIIILGFYIIFRNSK